MVNKYLAILVSIIILWSCQETSKLEHIVGKTMGTTYSIKYLPEINTPERIELSASIKSELRHINSMMSTYKRDSEISKFNQLPANQNIEISKSFFKVLEHAINVAEKTDGFFDPTIGPIVNLWGFGPDGIKEVPSEDMIVKTLNKVGYDKIVLSKESTSIKKSVDGVYLDLSASAKGYGVDAIGELLSKNHIKNYMVEIGGEVKTRGKNNGHPWKIAIETPNPATNRPYEAVLELLDLAVATSGSYRNFYTKEGKTFSHTINPKTGKPITHNLVSVTVIDDDSCMVADTYATALMAIGGDAAYEKAKEWGIKALFIYQNTKNGQKFFSQKKTSDTF